MRGTSKTSWAMMCARPLAVVLAGCATAPPKASEPDPPSTASEGDGEALVAPKGPTYRWKSPNGWKGESFPLPPKNFAPTLGLHGREVLRFSPGYFKADAPDAWTYAFVLLVDERQPLSAQRLATELHTYYVGLGRHLGKKRMPDLAPEQVVIEHVDTIPATSQSARVQHTFRGTVVDPWNTQAPVDLNLRLSTWLCEGGRHQAVFVAASPLPYTDDIWRRLAAEHDAFHCGG